MLFQGFTLMSLKSYLFCNKAATAIEYALIAAGISMAILGAVALFGGDLGSLFNSFSEVASGS